MVSAVIRSCPVVSCCGVSSSLLGLLAWCCLAFVFAAPALSSERATRTSGASNIDPTADVAFAATLEPGTKFRDCPRCPEMIVIPAGKFTMGRKTAADGQDDLPRPQGVVPAHEVTIDKAFAVGVYDVTREQYAAFVRQTGRPSRDGCLIWPGDQWRYDSEKNWLRPGFSQTGMDPVVCVSWEDAHAYVRWLNDQLPGSPLTSESGTGGPYRLLTIEEAEYTAASGRTSSYSWGSEARRDRANYGADQCLPCQPARQGRDHWLHTSPVGAFPANAFGVYDSAGNVWQWTDTCWPAAPTPSAWHCRMAALHGGSWLNDPRYLRTSEYSVKDRLDRDTETGFRVARTVHRDKAQ